MDAHPLILVLAAIGVWTVLRLAIDRLKRLDGEAVEMVRVRRADFEAGHLPAVCTKSGVATDTVMQVPLRRRLGAGNVPVSRAVADRYHRWFSVGKTAFRVLMLAVIVSVGVAIASGGEVTPTTEVVVTVCEWVGLAAFAVWWLSPFVTRRLTVDASAADRADHSPDASIVLRGVHPRFAEAVIAARAQRDRSLR